jgi:uncharacterized protein YndB with AHSA1/START domain
MKVEVNRIFQAPRERVWAAWTEPEQVAEWWGPHHFHVPVESIDLDVRPGGHYYLTMVETASGTKYPAHFEIVEVLEHRLLVFTSPPEPEYGMPDEITTRVEFSDVDGGTRVNVVSGPYTDQMGPNAETGWAEQFEKLDALVLGRAA